MSLEYYENIHEAAKRFGKDRSWINQLCLQGRIAPHVRRFDREWFIPRDAWILEPGESAPIYEGFPGYLTRHETAKRLGKSDVWIYVLLREERLVDDEGNRPEKFGRAWAIPEKAKIQTMEKEHTAPKERRQYWAQKQRESRERKRKQNV